MRKHAPRRSSGATRRPKARDARAEREALLRATIAALPDAVVVTSLDRTVLEANAAAASLFGRPLEELIGASVDELVPPTDRAVVARHERHAIAGSPQRYETRIRTAAGLERVVSVCSAALIVEGRNLGTAATLRDVTDERMAQEILAGAEARYRQLFERASDAIVTFDAAGRFTTVNHASEIISGYGREELVGAYFAPMIPDEELPLVIAEFRKALSGESGQFETSFTRKGGEVRRIAVTYTSPMPTEEVLCVIRDVTEQKLLQQQLIQSEKMAAIGQLVSGVAHELNNPLASILAFAQLVLLDRKLNDDHQHSATVIASESRRATRIVNNLLTFARQHRAEKVPTNLNAAVDATLELRAYELRVRGIEVEKDYDRRMPETMVDAHQLQQVFLNIITNAEQAMADREGEHALRVRTRYLGSLIRIEIEDTGPGIPSEALDRIFNPFYTTKPEGSGTGLGLSISLGIVSEHGGRLRAENVRRGGARFSIDLPYTPPVARDEPAVPAGAVYRPPVRILVADDEENIRLALARYLTGCGHTVVVTGSGRDALRLALEEQFDAVFLDIRMPDMSGPQLFDRLTRARPAMAARVLFLTGDTVSLEVREFLARAGRPYMAKPFEFDALVQSLPESQLSDAPEADLSVLTPA